MASAPEETKKSDGGIPLAAVAGARSASESDAASHAAKHTPGPWTFFDGHRKDVLCMRHLVGANGQGFAHTVGLGDPEDSANAHLIAAAPELYEACEAALKVIPCLEVRNWPPGFELKRDALTKLRAALAKVGSGNQGAIETADPTRRSARAEEGDH